MLWQLYSCCVQTIIVTVESTVSSHLYCDDVSLHCSFTVARRLIFELTWLTLAHFVCRGTALNRGTWLGWPRPGAATDGHIRKELKTFCLTPRRASALRYSTHLGGGGAENARLENAAPNCRTGKRGKRHVWKAKWCTSHVIFLFIVVLMHAAFRRRLDTVQLFSGSWSSESLETSDRCAVGKLAQPSDSVCTCNFQVSMVAKAMSLPPASTTRQTSSKICRRGSSSASRLWQHC